METIGEDLRQMIRTPLSSSHVEAGTPPKARTTLPAKPRHGRRVPE